MLAAEARRKRSYVIVLLFFSSSLKTEKAENFFGFNVREQKKKKTRSTITQRQKRRGARCARNEGIALLIAKRTQQLATEKRGLRFTNRNWFFFLFNSTATLAIQAGHLIVRSKQTN
jgi:hypothetical protein